MIAKIMSKNGSSKVVDLNRRKAIHERCLNCVCWEVHRVNGCDLDDCKLHPFRTGVGKQDAKARSKAIKEYCGWCTNGKIALCSVPLCSLYMFRKSGMGSAQESVSFLENRDIEGDFDREAEADDITSVPFVMEDGNPCGTRNLMERFPPGRVSKDFVEIV